MRVCRSGTAVKSSTVMPQRYIMFRRFRYSYARKPILSTNGEEAVQKQERAELAPRISFVIMATIAGLSILTIFVALGVPSYTKELQSWLGTLAAVAALAIASNQVIHSWSEIRCAKGIDGLGNALTKIVAPFAAAVVAMVVSDQHLLWAFVGFAPLVALIWVKSNDRCVRLHGRPTDPPPKEGNVD